MNYFFFFFFLGGKTELDGKSFDVFRTNNMMARAPPNNRVSITVNKARSRTYKRTHIRKGLITEKKLNECSKELTS